MSSIEKPASTPPRFPSRGQTSGGLDDEDLDWDITAPTKPVKKETPGPGSYNSHYYGSIGHKCKSGAGKRILGRHFVPHKPPAGPGPAAYNPRLAKNGPSFSLAGRLQQIGTAVEEAYPSPGPGEYNIAGDMNGKSTAASVKWRTTIYGDRLLSPKPPNQPTPPGPGSYDPQQGAIGKDAPKMTIHAPVPPPPREGPGPGEYNPRYDITSKATPTYSLGSRLTPNPLGTYIDNTLPGPGAYHIRSACFDDGEQSTSATAPGRTFGERLDPAADNGLPGPGDYEPDNSTQARKAAPSFSMKDRQKTREIELTPGPGSYDIVEVFGKDAKRVTLKSRVNPAPRKPLPGPGHYDVQTVASTKHVSGPSMNKPLSGKNYHGYRPTKKDDAGASVPGPGQYSPRNELVDKVHKSMGITIKGRAKPREDYNPVGPGEYTLPPTLGNNARIVMKRRSRTFELDTLRSKKGDPGPGAYSPETYGSIADKTSPRKPKKRN